MPSVVNPRIALLIKGASDWESDGEVPKLDMSIDVSKNLDPEPNEATVTIDNLNENTRSRIIDPSVRDTPIEIWFAPFGSSDLVKCFVGEINFARSEYQAPGIRTTLACTSQQWHMRSKFISRKTYEAGTSISQIIDDLIEVIDLPTQKADIPTGNIILSQSFSGPAYMLLKKFIMNYGLFCHITDGILNISGVYSPSNPTIVKIPRTIQVSEPMPTERKDAVDVLLHTITDTNNINPFAKQTKRAKRRWSKQALSRNDYTEYEAVDDIIFGVECETLGIPVIIPDNIVEFEGLPSKYRVQAVTHHGDTREGVITNIRADIYEGETTYGGAFGGPADDAALDQMRIDIKKDYDTLVEEAG